MPSPTACAASGVLSLASSEEMTDSAASFEGTMSSSSRVASDAVISAPSAVQLADGSAVTNGTLVLVAIAAFVASFAISLGPVMWVMLSEIFPNEERAAAISIVGFWNSLVSASVTLLFPKELATWGPAGTFLAYGLLAGAGLLFIVALAPETKGKTLEELERLLARPKQVVG